MPVLIAAVAGVRQCGPGVRGCATAAGVVVLHHRGAGGCDRAGASGGPVLGGADRVGGRGRWLRGAVEHLGEPLRAGVVV